MIPTEADHPEFHARFRGSPSLARTLRVLHGGAGPLWPDAKVLAAEVEVSRDAARGALPRALRVPPRARATVFVAEYARTPFGVAYRESGVLLHATLRGEAVACCVWMVVDDDTALTLGRELFGFPKKLATIDLDTRPDGGMVGRVRRRGLEVLSLQATAPRRETRRGVFGARPIVNVRGLPGGPGLLLRMEVPERPRALHAADVSVHVAGSPFDPLAELGLAPTTPDGTVGRLDVAVRPDGLRALLPPVRPAGLVGPSYLLAELPFRTY